MKCSCTLGDTLGVRLQKSYVSNSLILRQCHMGSAEATPTRCRVKRVFICYVLYVLYVSWWSLQGMRCAEVKATVVDPSIDTDANAANAFREPTLMTWIAIEQVTPETVWTHLLWIGPDRLRRATETAPPMVKQGLLQLLYIFEPFRNNCNIEKDYEKTIKDLRFSCLRCL